MKANTKLFSPLKIRSVTIPNRIVLSPLCMYSANDGVATEWQFAHLSTFARGKTGLIFAEATAVEARGRITPGCLGIWTDEQAEALIPVMSFIEKMGCVPGMQLAHAGRKAGTKSPWNGGTPLDEEDIKAGNSPWDIIAPSDIPVAEGWVVPKSMDEKDIKEIVKAFSDAAKRAVKVGFKVIEIHSAHGYLMHSFLSPLANKRNDSYGGDIHGRMRLLLEVVDAVRSVIPEDMPLFCRISAVDGIENGWEIEDSVILAEKLGDHGVDVIDCSGGGISGAPLFRVNKSGKPMKTNMDRGPGFQVPFAEKVKKESGMKTMAVGVIVDPHQAEQVLKNDKADLIAIGRELMYNPFWSLHAAQALKADPDFDMWPDQYKWGVNRRGKLADFKGVRDEVIDEKMVVPHLSGVYTQK